MNVQVNIVFGLEIVYPFKTEVYLKPSLLLWRMNLALKCLMCVITFCQTQLAGTGRRMQVALRSWFVSNCHIKHTFARPFQK